VIFLGVIFLVISGLVVIWLSKILIALIAMLLHFFSESLILF